MRKNDACYDRGVAPLFFLNTTPQFGSLRQTSPKKTDLMNENKTAMMPDGKSHGLGIQRGSSSKTKGPIIYLFPDESISRLRSPVTQKQFSPKKGTPLS